MQLSIPDFKSVKAPLSISDEWKAIFEQLNKREITSENFAQSPIVFFADNGISNSHFSLNGGNYTSSFAILASDGQLHAHANLVACDIAIARYFPELARVLDLKVASGSKNFLESEALEPARLKKALNCGQELLNNIKSQVVYLKAIGAGNELAAECLIKSLWNINGQVELINSGQLEFNSKFVKLETHFNHPFSYLEKFGGYETAAMVGLILKSIEAGKLILLEGASALAAMSIVIRMFPEAIDFFQVVSIENSTILRAFCELHGIKPLFNLPPVNPKLFYLDATESLLKSVLKEETSAGTY
ncbi:MAG: nicotinate-nucleotide--dimethylbenzimidazole phosphoribosyltransferase [Bacteroidia bacterium]